jgi:D-glycero-alpha-D-manno-heptose-7-phosphate kinase
MRPVHVKAPLRLGLAGGGTDVAPYRNLFGGCVVNVTICLYAHCQLATTGHSTEFHATDFGCVDGYYDSNDALNQQRLDLHRAVHKIMVNEFLNGYDPGLRVTTYSDSPPGSGIGSSSALVVAMVKAYDEMFELNLLPENIARLSYRVERVECGMSGGMQDQYAATFGGFNTMIFSKNDDVEVKPINISEAQVNDFESHMLLYYTGRSRTGAKIIESQVANTINGDKSSLEAMHRLKKSAEAMSESLAAADLKSVLGILTESWYFKKATAPGISNDHIERIADSAIMAGAMGVKVSGAGGGGFMIIIVQPELRSKVIRALEPLGGVFYPVNINNKGVQSWKTVVR